MAGQIIRKGSTFRFVTRWEQPVIKYVPITGVSNAAPVVVTAATHGMPDGWRFAISGVNGGGSALNSKHTPPRDRDYHKGKVLTANTIEINAKNGAAWPAYASGGVLQYNLPVDLAGVTAVLQVRETLESGTPLLMELTSADDEIIIDDGGMVTAIFGAEKTSALTVTDAFFDMELTFPDGSVMAYPATPVKFSEEVTRV